MSITRISCLLKCSSNSDQTLGEHRKLHPDGQRHVVIHKVHSHTRPLNVPELPPHRGLPRLEVFEPSLHHLHRSLQAATLPMPAPMANLGLFMLQSHLYCSMCEFLNYLTSAIKLLSFVLGSYLFFYHVGDEVSVSYPGPSCPISCGFYCRTLRSAVIFRTVTSHYSGTDYNVNFREKATVLVFYLPFILKVGEGIGHGVVNTC